MRDIHVEPMMEHSRRWRHLHPDISWLNAVILKLGIISVQKEQMKIATLWQVEQLTKQCNIEQCYRMPQNIVHSAEIEQNMTKLKRNAKKTTNQK